MVEVQDYNYYVSARGADGNFYVQPVYNYTGTVCPVVTVKKLHIDEDNENNNTDNNETSNEVKVQDTRLNNLIIHIVIGIVILVSSIVIIGYKFLNKNR